MYAVMEKAVVAMVLISVSYWIKVIIDDYREKKENKKNKK